MWSYIFDMKACMHLRFMYREGEVQSCNSDRSFGLIPYKIVLKTLFTAEFAPIERF